MTLASRVSRMETRLHVGCRFEGVSDEQLEAMIVALRHQIETATGMTEADLAAHLEQQISQRTLDADLDERDVLKFIHRIKMETLPNG